MIRKPKIDYATVSGRVFIDDGGYQRLLYVAWKYKYSLKKAIKMLVKGLKKGYVEKVITKDMNQGYAKAIIDRANLIIKGAEYYGKNPLKSKIKKLFIESKGKASFKGNQNIKLISTDKLLIGYNFNGKRGRHDNWIECETSFGMEYLPLAKHIIKKAERGILPYTARIVIQDRKNIKIHISVPVDLYTTFFGKGIAYGNRIASLDLNSDRINMVIIDKQGVIRDYKTEWFPEVNRPGCPGKRVWTLRLQALGRLLRYAYYNDVGVVIFEDLDKIKRRNNKNNKTNNRNVNRKMSNFPKKRLLEHGILMAMKYGFKIYLLDPKNTSKLAEKIKEYFKLDRHTMSAYTLAVKYLNPETFKKLMKKDIQRRLQLT